MSQSRRGIAIAKPEKFFAKTEADYRRCVSKTLAFFETKDFI